MIKKSLLGFLFLFSFICTMTLFAEKEYYPNIEGRWEGKIYGYMNVEKSSEKTVKPLTWKKNLKDKFYTDEWVIEITNQKGPFMKGKMWIKNDKKRTLKVLYGVMSKGEKELTEFFTVTSTGKALLKLIDYNRIEYSYSKVVPGKFQSIIVGELKNKEKENQRPASYMSFHTNKEGYREIFKK
ncbi:MAG: hypothetical protein K9M56_03435 [Victivallales bacterium]|nr:hypothetical protein [Victivallales bacterium]